MCQEVLSDIQVNTVTVRKLLQGINVKKAVGPDNVSPHTIRRCATELTNPMTALFQTCITENCWPSLWKQARVVPVHKKQSRTDPANYRPISLLSIVSKIFEKVIAEELIQRLEDHNLLSNKQFGF